MLQIAALVISILILHGLLGKMAGLRVLFATRVHAGVLRQLTGIWDRADLVKHFGAHDEAYYFTVSQRKIMKARRFLRWIFGNIWIEIILVAALLYLAMGNFQGQPKLQAVVVGVGGIYFIIVSVLTFKMSVRSKAQFDEEIAYLQGQRLKKFAQKQS